MLNDSTPLGRTEDRPADVQRAIRELRELNGYVRSAHADLAGTDGGPAARVLLGAAIDRARDLARALRVEL